MTIYKTCVAPGCGKEFAAKRRSARYCSPKCKQRVLRAGGQRDKLRPNTVSPGSLPHIAAVPPAAGTAVDRTRLVSLRVAGFTWASIADQVGGLSAEDAERETRAALSERAAKLPPRELEVELELQRLDELTRTAQLVMRSASSTGDWPAVLAANNQLLRISARRSRMLGLDGLEPEEPEQPEDELSLIRKRLAAKADEQR